MRNIVFLLLIFVFANLNAQNDRDHFSLRSPLFKDNSVLASGQIYKLKIEKSGIYKLTYSYLNSMGINPKQIEVSKIQLYNNGGGKLNQLVEETYTDDLLEISYFSSGLSDNSFDENDYILFYAGGPDKWYFNEVKNIWEYEKNVYSISNYVFLRLGVENHKIMPDAISDNPGQSYSQTDVYSVYEEDKLNLLASYVSASGSGQEWYNLPVNRNSQIDFSSKFLDFKFSGETNIKVDFAGRNSTGSVLSVIYEDNTSTFSISSVDVTDAEKTYAWKIEPIINFIPKQDKIDIKLKYNGDEGWLDKITVNSLGDINLQPGFQYISNKNIGEGNNANFVFNNTIQNLIVWDITDLDNIENVKFTTSNNSTIIPYNKRTNQSRLLAVNKEFNFPTPVSFEKIDNQNLHSISDADMLIVYYSDFEEAALKLAQYRSEKSGLNVYAIDQEQIFNEFSCGKKDPTAVRDFARMLKFKNESFNFLLLMGDGSYDARHLITDKDDFVVVWETEYSLHPIESYPSDDYFGMLSVGEGVGYKGDMEIAVGRMPVRSAEQANFAVQKVIDFESNSAFYGDWQNNITLAADDEDEGWDSTHFYGAEKIYDFLEEKYPTANINKIYLDYYEQEQNSGGQRYPDVNRDINNDIYKGILMFIYFGHGGPKGLAQERVMQHEDIDSWTNKTKLPLLITATCSFTGFDDPSVNTAGEEAFLRDKGGAISLITTVRAVFASSNDALVRSIMDAMFMDENSRFKPIGELLRLAKNTTSESSNKRKFLLFGDPSMKLRFPEYKIITSHINSINVENPEYKADTLSAMEKVKIKGYIAGKDNQKLNEFNGTVNVTLFDKAQNLKTRGNDHDNDPSKQREFILQKNILFKGLAQVTDGEFSITFILPKDINYNYGYGKLSYYAINDNLEQSTGYFDNFIIGGTADSIDTDTEGPIISLYMNDRSFADGGITNDEPILLGDLVDKSGINITGLSVGHDLTLEKDSDGEKIVINDFYKSEKDNFTKGSFSYPFSKLDPGKYSLNITAWDIFNNKSEKRINFVVVDSDEQNIRNLYNFPNPFSSHTEFRFEHDLPDNNLDVLINIFSLSGKLVKSIQQTVYSQGYVVSDIEWDGTDDFGVKLANGVYIFNAKVFSQEYNIKRESKFQKLVIIR